MFKKRFIIKNYYKIILTITHIISIFLSYEFFDLLKECLYYMKIRGVFCSILGKHIVLFNIYEFDFDWYELVMVSIFTGNRAVEGVSVLGLISTVPLIISLVALYKLSFKEFIKIFMIEVSIYFILLTFIIVVYLKYLKSVYMCIG